MKNAFLILFVLIGQIVNGQFYEYENRNDSYEGGEKQFYKEFHEELIKQTDLKCDNKKELYFLKVAVYPDAQIKFVKDSDTLSINKNKCTYDIARKIVSKLKNWSPLENEGKKEIAVATFPIFLDALGPNYKDNYSPNDYMIFANYEGGIPEFRKRISDVLDFNDYKSGFFKTVVKFIVNEKGGLEDFEMKESSGNKEYDESVLKAFRKVKGKWTPASLHNIPIKSYYTIPMGMQFD